VVAVSLHCAVAANQLIARFTVDLDGLCRVLGTHHSHIFGRDHFGGSGPNLILADFMALEFLPLAMHREARLANELAAVSTKALCFFLPALLTLHLAWVSHLLQGVPHLKKVLDVESRGQAGHALSWELGHLAAVGASCAESVGPSHHQPLETGLAEDMKAGQDSGPGVLLQTHRARQLVSQLFQGSDSTCLLFSHWDQLCSVGECSSVYIDNHCSGSKDTILYSLQVLPLGLGYDCVFITEGKCGHGLPYLVINDFGNLPGLIP